MTARVVVLGSGYAGAGAVKRLESELGEDADVTWISDVDYHLLLHEVHRCIRDPDVADHVTIPVRAIKSSGTTFRQGEVVGVDCDDRTVELADGSTVAYDYLLVAIGSRTAFFGIDGLREHAHTLKSLDDAVAIHEAVREAAAAAGHDDPAEVVVGGAGLSGIQTAGELAALREEWSAPVEVRIVEGLDSVMPNGAPELQDAIRKRLLGRGVDIVTGEFVGGVDEDRVYVGDNGSFDYDVLIWTGGITGREAARRMDLQRDERNHRILADRTFRTDDDRVFAIGDCALIDQGGDDVAPPTAQAAWQAAAVAGENVARAVRGQPLATWTYRDKGTVVSIGDEAVAHDVEFLPFSTFGGLPAELLKKAIAARWIKDVAGLRRAAGAWSDM